MLPNGHVLGLGRMQIQHASVSCTMHVCNKVCDKTCVCSCHNTAEVLAHEGCWLACVLEQCAPTLHQQLTQHLQVDGSCSALLASCWALLFSIVFFKRLMRSSGPAQHQDTPFWDTHWLLQLDSRIRHGQACSNRGSCDLTIALELEAWRRMHHVQCNLI
jgi:hypothetical protein